MTSSTLRLFAKVARFKYPFLFIAGGGSRQMVPLILKARLTIITRTELWRGSRGLSGATLTGAFSRSCPALYLCAFLGINFRDYRVTQNPPSLHPPFSRPFRLRKQDAS